MARKKKLAATSDQLDAVFGVLEDALRKRGHMLPDDEASVKDSEAHVDLESVELPEALKDPAKTLERGREILESGFVTRNREAVSDQTESYLAQAARNGEEISDDVKALMRRDRQAAEKKKKNA